MTVEVHHQSLEESATQLENEARMMLPGVQAILGFQLIAAFNERFEHLSAAEQVMHFVSFLLLALTMGLLMAPAAYHRQVERRAVSARFIRMSSTLLTMAMVPFSIGVAIDAYLVGKIILDDTELALVAAGGVLLVLAGLWFVLPRAVRPARD